MFVCDLIAGLTVASILIPQGMAYASLAGVAPIYGLYAGLVPMIIYAIFGTSRQLSIGPVAISALLVLSGVSALAEPGTSEYLGLVITAGFYIGLAQIALSFLRLGFLVNFISKPVITGFTSAAAIIILGSQLKDALGISMPRMDTVLGSFSYTATHIGEINVIAFVICVISFLSMLFLKKWKKALPGALIVIIIGTLICYFAGWESNGVDVVGNVPSGLPSFTLPIFNLEVIRSLIPVILTITVMSIVESISIARVLESQHKNYSINPNQEFFAIGMSKAVSAFFQSIPTSSSFTRSAINSEAGAKTTISSIICALVIVIALLFLTPLLYFIPKAILAAIILLAVFKLFDIKGAVQLYRTHKKDFAMMLATFVATLILGIEEGVLIGVLLSIGMVLYQSTKPHIATLGRIPGTEHFRNIDRFPEGKEVEQILVLRFDDQLYFANANYFKEEIIKRIVKYDRSIEHLLLDASNIHNIDSTGIATLLMLNEDLESRGVILHIANARGPVRDALYKNGLMKNAHHHHVDLKEAISAITLNKKEGENRYSLQTNEEKQNKLS